MKKFRGQKKYYKRLLNNDLDAYFENLDFNSWFDYWHDHPDLYGYGNLSWKNRELHLLALIRRYNFLKEKLRNRTDKFQIFCLIDINDSSQDSVFVHTKNPNHDDFPAKFERYSGNLSISKQIRDFVESSGYDWFFHTWDRDNEMVNLIYVYDKNVGLSI